MALDDFVESEVAIAVAATAAVLSPRVRGALRTGAVYGLAGVMTAADAVGAFAEGIARGMSGGRAQGSAAADGQSTQHEETSIDVDVPVSVAYNQWTQFETFPQFMDGVEQVTQRDDTHLHWKVKVGGKTQEWDAEIVEQAPDQRIAWRSTSGAPNEGLVTFDKRGAGRTRVTLRLSYTPQGPAEQAGAALGVLSRQVEDDLNRFKAFVEARGDATGAWRGEVQGGAVQETERETAAAAEGGGRTRRTRRAQGGESNE